jgi:hypothetical protein
VAIRAIKERKHRARYGRKGSISWKYIETTGKNTPAIRLQPLATPFPVTRCEVPYISLVYYHKTLADNLEKNLAMTTHIIKFSPFVYQIRKNIMAVPTYE